MLESSRDRVRAIALAYAQGWRLSQGAEDGRVDPTSVLRALVEEMRHAHPAEGRSITIRVEVQGVLLSFDQLVPMVLLSRELVANVLAHAFVGRKTGNASLVLAPSGPGRATLTVTDDGVGMPPDLTQRREKNLGLALVTMLSEQIEADVTAPPASASGCRWVLSFPLLSIPRE